MKTAAIALGVAGAITAAQAQSCEVVSDVTMTFYGFPDNGDSTATAYDCLSRGYVASGTGSYDDPLTFATADGEYDLCEIIYAPYLQKYLIHQDECDACTTDWDNGIAHIDIWTGNSVNGGNAQIQCEDDLTPNNSQQLIRYPATDLATNTATLWDGSTCNTQDTYPSYTASDYCNGGSSSGCQTGCSWSGHCIGCPCETYNDCSGDYICTNGLCASP